MKAKEFYTDLLAIIEQFYKPCGLPCYKIVEATENREYGAYTGTLHNNAIQFRTAKTTPTKKGQFVALYKRAGNGSIVPYDATDNVDLFIINVHKDKCRGQFIFPKDLLLHKGFVSENGMGGKRAIRVYPPWDTVDNRQAQTTQHWQSEYFIELQPNFDKNRLKKLFL